MISKPDSQTFRRFITPHTDDGLLREITFHSPSEFRCVAQFEVPRPLSEQLGRKGVELIYVARSRISRLGISLRPVGPVEVHGQTCRLELAGKTLLPEAGLEPYLPDALVPGVAIGRLVLCDLSRRLSAAQVHEALQGDSVKLPSQYSLGADGRIHFPAQLCRYRFRFPLKLEHLVSVISSPDGKELLNFLQVRESVSSVMLPAGEGVITSCAMFLQRHYFLLETADHMQGRHFHATVLDPLETRMSNVFLEFENPTDSLIVNPSASGYLYEAEETFLPTGRPQRSGRAGTNEDYRRVRELYGDLSKKSQFKSYADRPIDLIEGTTPFAKAEVTPIQRAQLTSVELSKAIVEAVGRHRAPGFTALCEYFPDYHEHPALLHAAATGHLRALIFRQASYDHGPFLSERDHARLAEYAEFGVQIHWLNEIFTNLATFTQKARRGFFAFPHAIAPFQDALVLGVYGSTVDLPTAAADELEKLIGKLYKFFGKNIALLTGGGGGVMRHVLETGKKLGCLVGSSFLENADQNLDPRIDFYHTFQSGSRHMRQRWFEVARCHLFSIGGIGTLEEIGMTLTDIKLGLINTEPVVLFGASGQNPYWQHLGEQLRCMSLEGRAPAWLRTHLLVTADADEALDFYKHTLQVG